MVEPERSLHNLLEPNRFTAKGKRFAKFKECSFRFHDMIYKLFVTYEIANYRVVHTWLDILTSDAEESYSMKSFICSTEKASEEKAKQSEPFCGILLVISRASCH